MKERLSIHLDSLFFILKVCLTMNIKYIYEITEQGRNK